MFIKLIILFNHHREIFLFIKVINAKLKELIYTLLWNWNFEIVTQNYQYLL